MKTKMLVLTLVGGAAMALSACNTVNGAGKDIKSAGTAVSDVSGQNAKKR